MQRLAILTVLSVAAAGWMVLQQQRLAAFQTEAAQQPAVETAAENTPAGDAAAPNAAVPGAANGANEAQPAAAALPPPDPAIVAAAEKLLRDARDRLYGTIPGTTSVRARFIERANIGTRRFTAEGTYLSGAYPALKLEYRVRIGGSEGELIEVCDGNVLRTSKVIRPLEGESKEPTFSQWTRKDITQIIKASSAEGTPEAAVLQAELSLGGVPALLASIERTMIFDTIREQVWQGQPTTIIEGRWRPEIAGRFSEQMGAGAQSLIQLLPDRVRIYFDKGTMFPTRILYRKLASRNPDVYTPLLSIEFTEIRINEGVANEEFRYLPPKGVDEIDETGTYLRMIEQLRGQLHASADPQPVDATEAAGTTSPAAAPEQQPAAP